MDQLFRTRLLQLSSTLPFRNALTHSPTESESLSTYRWAPADSYAAHEKQLETSDAGSFVVTANSKVFSKCTFFNSNCLSFFLPKTKFVAFALTLVCFFCVNAVLGQTAVFTENFGTTTSLPAGWLVSGSPTWTIATSPISSGYTGASGGSNAYAKQDIALNATLSSPTINFSNFVNATLTFGVSTKSWDKSVVVEVSKDGGSTWTAFSQNLSISGTTSWALQTISLGSAIDGASSVRIRWRINTAATSGNKDFYLDDVRLTGYSQPTTQASGISFNSVTRSSFTASWTNGNGVRRTAFLKEGTQGTITNPSDGTAYSANANWSTKGTQLGNSGYYCIFDGTGNSVNLTNLVPGTNYWLQVFEYNSDASGTASTRNYLVTTATNNPNNTATLCPSAIISYSQPAFCQTTSTATVTLTGTTGGTFSYTGTGTLSLNTTTGAITPSSSTAGTYTIHYQIPASGTCSAVDATTTVQLDATPTTATVASNTLNYCGTLTSGSLGGNTPTVGTGAWTQTSGPGTTTFSDATSGSSTATVSLTGTYVYTWSISNGSCTPSSKSVTVNYYEEPTTATVASSILSFCGLSSGSLGGNTPTVGTGAWSKVSGPGTVSFSSAALGTSTATVSVTGTYVFRWTISNGSCTPSTADVTVDYYATPTVSSISGAQTYCEGTTPANLSVSTTAGSGTIIQYEWYRNATNSNSGGTLVATHTSSATTDSYTPSTSTTGTLYYYVVVTNSNSCTVTSAVSGAVTVNTPPSKPAITPSSTTSICSGGSVVLTSSVTSGNQWYLNGSIISGATAQTHSATAGGSYTVVSTVNGCPSPASDATVVTVTTPPSITTNPSSRTVCADANATFSVSASNVAGYQWQVSTNGGTSFSAVTDGGVYSGATTATLTISNVTGLNSYQYRVVVSGNTPCGSVTSTAATLTVAAGSIWNGSVSTAWDNASNWCGGTPGSTTDVTIPAGVTNYPTLAVSTTGSARNITIQNGATLTVAGALQIAGSISNSGTFNATAGTIVFNGSTAQTIAVSSFQNSTVGSLTINKTAGSVTLNGTLITVSKDVTISAGNLTLGSNINVGGNWSRASAATFTPSGRTVTFNGTAAQVITVIGGGTASFFSLNINNAAGVSLSPLPNATNVNISSTLTLTSGVLNTNAILTPNSGTDPIGNKVVILQGATVSRPTTGGWVAGNLQKYISAGGTAITYEVGGPGTYRPITITTHNVQSAGSIIAAVSQSAGDHSAIGGSGLDETKSINRFFRIVPIDGITLSGGQTAIAFTYNTADVDAGVNTSSFLVRPYRNLVWQTGFTAGVTASTVTAVGVQNFLSATNPAQVVDFAIGECFRPNTSNLTVSSSYRCENNTADVTVTSSTLAEATYNVYYTLSGATNTTGVSTMVFNKSTQRGIFSTIELNNTGATTITINSIELHPPSLTCASTVNVSASFTVVPNTWEGTVSTDWSNSGNWSCGKVPTAKDNVRIPAGRSNYPVVTGTTGNNLYSLTIEAAASLTVTGRLQIATTITNSGTLTATAGTIELNGTAAQTIPAGAFAGNTIQNLVISNDVSLGGPLSLTGTLSFGSTGKTLTTGGLLTLKSTAAATARVADVTGNQISGNVTVERFVPTKNARKWTFVTAPVLGTTIREAWQNDVFITGPGTGGQTCGTGEGNGGVGDKYNSNGFDATISNASSMFTYNATQVNGSRWVTVPGTMNSLVPGVGYRMNLRGERGDCANQLNSATPAPPSALTLSASGSLQQGNVSVSLNAPGTHLYTLIGNPYASEISFSQFQATNAATISKKYWAYSPKNAANIYSVYDGTTTINFPSDVNPDIIASGQAFFVEAANASVTSPVLFREAHKTNGQGGNSMFRVMNWVEKLRVKYSDAADSHLDEIVVRFGDDAEITTAVNRYDVVSFNGGTYLASRKSTSRFAIQSRPLGFKTDTVALSVTATANGTYKLRFSEYENFVSAPVIELLDAYTSTVTNVKVQNSYTFSIDANAASKGDDRFKLVFKSGTALPIRSINLTAEHKQQNVQLNWTVTGEQDMSRYQVERSADGQTFERIGTVAATANNNSTVSYGFSDGQPLAGTAYYRIQAQGRSGEVRYSAVAKVQSASNVSVQLYPNPVKAKLNLLVSGAGASRYELQVLNMHGAEVIRRSAVVLQNGVVSMDTHSLSAGVYTLKLSNATGETITQTFVKQ